MKKKGSSCMQMKDYKGKPSGLMMEGSAMHMSMLHNESAEQEAKNDLNDMPVDDKASAMEMSPYKMGHESPAEFTGISGGSAFHNTGYGDKLATKEEKAEMRKKKAGANFFPPSNPKEKSSFKKPILDSSSPGYDIARPLYDSNKDGDTIFSDLNQDGTMVGRAIRKLFG
tara:strand:+ start:4113 stop:4622 length:510 start_codon:yes stop_codon:yes gene_type:complete